MGEASVNIMVWGFETLVVYALWAILLAVKVFALFDAIRRPADYFPLIGRQTKLLWVALTGVSVLAGLAPSPGTFYLRDSRYRRGLDLSL